MQTKCFSYHLVENENDVKNFPNLISISTTNHNANDHSTCSFKKKQKTKKWKQKFKSST